MEKNSREQQKMRSLFQLQYDMTGNFILYKKNVYN